MTENVSRKKPPVNNGWTIAQCLLGYVYPVHNVLCTHFIEVLNIAIMYLKRLHLRNYCRLHALRPEGGK